VCKDVAGRAGSNHRLAGCAPPNAAQLIHDLTEDILTRFHCQPRTIRDIGAIRSSSKKNPNVPHNLLPNFMLYVSE
jgi:hypothetical protein